MRALRLIISLLFHLVFAFTLDIREDTITRGTVNLSFGGLKIIENCYWSIVNNRRSIFTGSIVIEPRAALYISSISSLVGLDVTMDANWGAQILNWGTISFNSVTSYTTASYDIDTDQFDNLGEIYMAASGESTLFPATMNIFGNTFNNQGKMVFYQDQENSAKVRLGSRLSNSFRTMNNQGQICLHNQVYSQTTLISGRGCITADEGSSIYLTDPMLEVSNTQLFYLADRESSLQATSVELLLHKQGPITVVGFGNQNKIGLTATLSGGLFGGDKYTYDGEKGILTLYSFIGINSQEFVIGPNYDPSLFEIVTDSREGLGNVRNGALSYRGEPPNPIPDVCIHCYYVPEAPGIEDETFTTGFTSTQSDGAICTGNDEVIIFTDTDGEFQTVTNSLDSDCAFPFTTYTTTEINTNTDGSVTTDSGIVIVTTDSDGILTTTTSTFPPFTTYTTAETKTNSDGSVTTDSGIIIITTNSDGSITTTTSWLTTPETSYTTTFTSTESDGSVTTGTGEVIISTDSEGNPHTTTSIIEPESSYTTTFTSTESDGSVTTGTGEVIISTDSEGNPHTTTSIIDGPESSYTTTFTSTNSDGSVTTGTGEVIISTDSEGNPHTTTSIIEPESSYTTTFTSTASDGSVTTGTGEVIISTDSEGNPHTTTSIIDGPETSYTTTFTSTESDGSVTTGTGEVIISTDSEGNPHTTTSIIDGPETSYTTTFTSTESDGSVTTGTGEVIISTDSEGNPHTTDSSGSGSYSTSVEATFTTLSMDVSVSASSFEVVPTPSGSVDSLGFIDIEYLVWQKSGDFDEKYPFAPEWDLGFSWELRSGVTIYDSFDLILPYVFEFLVEDNPIGKRDGSDKMIYLEKDNIIYAECSLIAGTMTSLNSSLQCTVVDEVESDVSGIVEIPFTFNAGGTGSGSDIICANSFLAGTQTLQFYSGDRVLSVDVEFDGGSPSSEDPEELVHLMRPILSEDADTYYLLGGSCDTGLSSGSLSIELGDGYFECSSLEFGMTNSLNAWYLPKSFEEFNEITLNSCTEKKLVVDYNNVPEGYRVFLDIIGHAELDDATYRDVHYCTNTPMSSSTNTQGTSNSDYTTTFTSTNTDGSVTTGTGEVIISTDSEGNTYTTTSIIDGPETGYTTTFTSTNTDGSVTTGTGEVIISTDSEGNPHTTTSIIEGPETEVSSLSSEDVDSTSTIDLRLSSSTESTSSSSLSVPHYHNSSTTLLISTTLTDLTTTGVAETSTDSSIVITTTDNEGSTYYTTITQTSTSTTSTCSDYTTMLTSTNSLGEVVTDTGVVMESTDSNGYKTTITSIITETTCIASKSDDLTNTYVGEPESSVETQSTTTKAVESVSTSLTTEQEPLSSKTSGSEESIMTTVSFNSVGSSSTISSLESSHVSELPVHDSAGHQLTSKNAIFLSLFVAVLAIIFCY